MPDRTTSSPASAASPEAHFRAVFEATYVDLLRFAQRRVPPGSAEDVTADVFLVAWRRYDDLPTEVADARPWLFGVARATILNHRRGGGDARPSPYDSPANPDIADAPAYDVTLRDGTMTRDMVVLR